MEASYPDGTLKLQGLALVVLSGVLLACESGTSPLRVNTAPPVSSVDVAGLSIGSDFEQTGRLSVALVPRARDGSVVLNAGVTPGVELKAPVCYEAEGDITDVVEGGERPIAATLILDSSGSMEETDPDRKRIVAAREFARTIWSAGEKNEVALFDFGAGGRGQFAWSRMLSDFTRSPSELDAALQQIAAANNTPLYESVREILTFVDSRRPREDRTRIALVLSDGLPNGPSASLQDALSTASNVGIPIYTIGLGTAAAASQMARDSAVQVMQALAQGSAATYASAGETSDLIALFGAVGTAVSEGHLVHNLMIHPIPPPGAQVDLTVRVQSVGRQLTFRVPPGKFDDEVFTWPVGTVPGGSRHNFAGDGAFREDCGDQKGDCYYLPRSGAQNTPWRDAQPFQQEVAVIEGKDRWHLGADWNFGTGDPDAEKGAPVFASANGVVVKVADVNSGFGKVAFLAHDTDMGPFVTLYAHVDWCDAGPPTGSVVAGQQIAKVDRAATTEPYHLHFEVRTESNFVPGRAYTDAPLHYDGGVSPLRSEKECGIASEVRQQGQGINPERLQGQINPTYFVARHNLDGIRMNSTYCPNWPWVWSFGADAGDNPNQSHQAEEGLMELPP